MDHLRVYCRHQWLPCDTFYSKTALPLFPDWDSNYITFGILPHATNQKAGAASLRFTLSGIILKEPVSTTDS